MAIHPTFIALSAGMGTARIAFQCRSLVPSAQRDKPLCLEARLEPRLEARLGGQS
jgi:hypothetical protein